MPVHFDKYRSHHKAEELFNIVADVEKYPVFLPWIAAARIAERHEDWFIAELVASFAAFSHKYSSKVALKKPEMPGGIYEINVNLVSGPFKHLMTKWLFITLEDGMTEIVFEMDFKFKSVIFEKMFEAVFESAVAKMTGAFEKRADDILGKVS